MNKRVFLIVLDSVGIGEMPDAEDFGDKGANTLRSISKSEKFIIRNLNKMGYFNIDGVDYLDNEKTPSGAYGKIAELSKGKDTTIGHWEIAGIISKTPFPVFKEGFPKELLDEFSKKTGRGYLCNKPYSGTEVIKDFGDVHVRTGDLIIYTSADSVFQIAAHEDIVPVETLYKYCRIAREMLKGEYAVGRVIARPFTGKSGNYTRTSNRHDFSLLPPKDTMLDHIKKSGMDTIAVGKIRDIFSGKGISEYVLTKGNEDGMNRTAEIAKRDFNGLCFVNLVDFDMLYGHRNNIDGYANALSEFDSWLGSFIKELRDDDILMITADHGCDPGYTVSTDHSREYIPIICYGKNIKPVNLHTRNGFCDIGKTICDYLNVSNDIDGSSFLKDITYD